MKDIRIITTSGNSVWGVISKVIGSNVYENVISFNGDENLKTEFVGNNLFDGNLNWKDLFNDESTKTKELTMINDISITYRYKVKDTDDKMELLNKDTLILRYTNKEDEYVYLYYAINDVSNINSEIIVYSAEKDIMFSHFDDLNWKGQSAIIRGHTDRYGIGETEHTTNLDLDISQTLGYDFTWGKDKEINIKDESDIEISQVIVKLTSVVVENSNETKTFYNLLDETYTITGDNSKTRIFNAADGEVYINASIYMQFDGEILTVSYSFSNTGPSFTDWKVLSGEFEIQQKVSTHLTQNNKTFIVKNNYLNESDLLFAEPSIETENIPIGVEFDSGFKTSDFYYVIIFSSLQNEEEGVAFKQTGVNVERLPYKIFFGIIPKKEIHTGKKLYFRYYEDGTILKKEISSTFYTDTFRDAATTLSVQILDIPICDINNIEEDSDGINITINTLSSLLGNEGLVYDEDVKIMEVKFLDRLYNTTPNLPSIEKDHGIFTEYTKKRNIANEVKLYYSQFKKYKLSTIFSDNEYEILTQFVEGTDIEFDMKIGLQSEMNSVFVYPTNEKRLDNIQNKMGLAVNVNFEIPINSVAFNEYISQHRRDAKIGYLGGAGEKIVGGIVAGAGIGAVGGGGVGAIPGAIVGGLAGTGGAIFNGISHGREMKDLKATPDTPKSNFNYYGILVNMLIEKSSTFLRVLELPDDYKQRAYDYLYAMGYTIRKVDFITNWLNTRYYFNYIKTGSVFSNIGLNLSAKQKQIISDSMENGITVWYYRDKETFKGILNYEYENQEMSLID